jgi:hypothetical protein
VGVVHTCVVQESQSSQDNEISEIFVTTFGAFLHIGVAMELKQSWEREREVERGKIEMMCKPTFLGQSAPAMQSVTVLTHHTFQQSLLLSETSSNNYLYPLLSALPSGASPEPCEWWWGWL